MQVRYRAALHPEEGANVAKRFPVTSVAGCPAFSALVRPVAAQVRSSVIRLKRNATNCLPCDESLLYRVVKTAFNQRRKTLRTALKPLPEAIAGVPARFTDKRAEQLSVGEFVELTLGIEQG